MKRRDLAWLIGIVLVIAAWTGALLHPGQPPQPTNSTNPEFELRLILASDAQFQNTFRLTLKSTPQGAGHDTFLQVPGVAPPWDTHGAMDRETFEKLRAELERNGLWTVPSASSDDPEEQVLYTRLEVSQGERAWKSEWRGIPADRQKELVSCFLDSCLGTEIRRGLSELQAFKARPAGIDPRGLPATPPAFFTASPGPNH